MPIRLIRIFYAELDDPPDPLHPATSYALTNRHFGCGTIRM
jgi:hypothetical protein